MAKVTIEDISRETGLSRGTISRALNDRPDINSQTKERILAVCRRLHYVPSSAARSLATGRSAAVAVLVSDTGSRFSAGCLRGIIDRAERANYLVHVLELRPNLATERLERLPIDRVDGVLNTAALAPDAVAILRERIGKRRLVTCDALGDVACDLIAPDYAESGRIAARLMLTGGVRRLLYLHRPGDAAADAHHSGFAEICQAHAIDAAAATLTLETDESTRDPLIDRLGDADGVIAADDHLAVRVLLTCCGSGRIPGRDVAVIGHGNDPVGAQTRPALTTIDYDAAEIGRRGMDTLLQRIAGERQDAPIATRVAPRLVERESTANLRSS